MFSFFLCSDRIRRQYIADQHKKRDELAEVVRKLTLETQQRDWEKQQKEKKEQRKLKTAQEKSKKDEQKKKKKWDSCRESLSRLNSFC